MAPLCLLVAAALWTSPAEAAAPRSQACKAVAPLTVAGEQRIALVMGNRAYDGEWDELPTSVNNDADRMERKLKSLGFGVIRGHDLDKEGMDNCILKLRTAIGMMREKSLVVVYYSGHGMGVKGRSFLAPVGSRLPEDPAELDGALLDVQTMVSFIGSSAGRTNLLFLDSCRNNGKYLKSRRGPSKGYPESAGTGFSKLGLTGQSGTVIAYAVDPGRVASAAGGDGDTSLYTGTLLRNLDTPGVSLMTALNNTIRDVKAVSDQTPWIEGDTSLLEPIVFTPSALTDPADDMAWAKSQGENTVAAYRRYERDFPKGSHVTEARASVQVLERLLAPQVKAEAPLPIVANSTAVVTPPPNLNPPKPEPSTSPQPSAKIESDISQSRKAAEQGDASAQFYLGRMYDEGLGVKKDHAQAVTWYRKAAEQGDVGAQQCLGISYDYGVGVKQDHAQAEAWYRKAAELGFAPAQFSLGTMYENGNGVKKDVTQAVTWYRKAADQGDKDAKNVLARLGR